jgi:hypothetical protein
MLEMLRQMTRSELAEVFAVLQAPPGSPEDAIHALAGTPWLFRWSSGDSERPLLIRAAHALGMTRELKQRHWTNAGLERRIFAVLCAQAIEGAPEEMRAAMLERLVGGTQEPAPPETPMAAHQLAALRARLSAPDGLRAFATLPESAGLAPQFDATRPTPLAFLAGILSPSPWEPFSGQPFRPEWARARRGLDLRALFRVLTLCWRTRERLLVERRAEAARLDSEIQRLVHEMQERLQESFRRRRHLPWYRQPVSAVAIATGASAAGIAQGLLLGDTHPLVILAVLGSAFCAAILHPAGYDNSPARRAQLAQLNTLRRQRLAVQRQIALLEH